MGGLKPALTVWLFNMNWTALSFTSFLTLLYVSKSQVKEKTPPLPNLSQKQENFGMTEAVASRSCGRISQRKVVQ